MIKKYKVLPPAEFKVLKVYSFRDPVTGFSGYVYYQRPQTPEYNKRVSDDFDKQFMEWICSMNLDNVKMAHSEDITYEGQLDYILNILQKYKHKDKMYLTCHGDYSMDEILQKREITGFVIDFNVYWNARESDIVLSPGGMFTFDKSKEQYFGDVFSSITT